MAVDQATEAGAIDAKIERGVRDLFLDKNMDAKTIAAFRNEWFTPYTENVDAAALIEAYEALGGDGATIDSTKVQKMFAVAASQGEMTPAERQGLRAVQGRATFDDAAKTEFAGQLLGLFLESLDSLGPTPTLTGAIVDDIVDMASTHAANKKLIGAVDDLFFRSTLPEGTARKFLDVFRGADDLSRDELELTKAFLADHSGTLDAPAVDKLLIRIGANDKITADEREVVRQIEQSDLTPAARKVVEDWKLYGVPSQTKKHVLGRLGTAPKDLFGGDANKLVGFIHKLDNGYAVYAVGRALAALAGAARKDAFKTPLSGAAQGRFLKSIATELASYESGAIQFDRDRLALKGMTGAVGTDELGAILAAHKAGIETTYDVINTSLESVIDNPILADGALLFTEIDNDRLQLHSLDLSTGERLRLKVDGFDNQTIKRVSTAQHDGKLLVAGSAHNNGQYGRHVRSYDLESGATTELPDLPAALSGTNLAVIGDAIYAIGGTDHNRRADHTLKGANSTPTEPSTKGETVESTVKIDSTAKPLSLKVRAEISAEKHGRVVVELVPPGGEPIRLHRGAAEAFEVDVNASHLADLEHAKGEWTLRVSNYDGDPQAVVKNWSLAFGASFESIDGEVEGRGRHVLKLEGDRWATKPSLGLGVRNAAFGELEDGRIAVIGSGEKSEGSSQVTTETAPTQIYDPKTGKTTALPSIDVEGFVPSDVKIKGSRVIVSGHHRVDGEPNNYVAHLNLDADAPKWTVVATTTDQVLFNGDTNLINQDGSLGHQIGIRAPTLDPRVAPPAETAGPSRPTTGQAGAAHKEKLVRMTIDYLGETGAVSGEEARGLIDMLTDMASEDALSASVKEKVAGVFDSATLDDEAIAAFRDNWFAAGHSTVTAESFAEAVATAGSPMPRLAMMRLASKAGALVSPERALLDLPHATAIADDDRSSFFAQIAGHLTRRTSTMTSQGELQAEEAKLVNDVAIELQSLDPTLAPQLKRAVKNLLLRGRHAGESANEVRPFAKDGLGLSAFELRMGVANFGKSSRRLDLPELRAIATLTDADGVRDAVEDRLLRRLPAMRLSPGARRNMPVMLAGLTTPADLVGRDGPSTAKVDGSGELVVWASENNTASGGKTFKVDLGTDIEVRDSGLHTNRIHVSGATKVANPEGIQPFVEGAQATTDGFDQVQMLWAANHMLARLEAVGIDIESLQKDGRNNGIARLKANGISDMNAYYSPTDNEMVFGTSGGRWHLASDKDVVVHELGHYVLDHINPNMVYRGDSGAIHEAFGDVMAAFIFNDPEMSEDFGAMRAAHGEDFDAREGLFLRNVDNDLTLAQAGTQVHDRGRVYGGMMWRVKERVAEIVGDDEEAAELMLGVVAKHGFFYNTTTVKPEQFVEALISSAREHLADKVTATQVDDIVEAIRTQGVARKMIAGTWQPPVPEVSDIVSRVRAAVKANATYRGRPSLAQMTRVINGLSGVGQRHDVQFLPQSEVKADGLQKIVLRSVATDPHTKEKLDIEDGFVSVSIRDGVITEVNGRGTRLPEALDFSELPGGFETAVEGALQKVKSFVSENQIHNKWLSEMAHGSLTAELESGDVKSTQVLFNGRRAIKIITKLGEFVVEPKGWRVTPNRMAYV